jgi:IclR family acetate operon transcriptional repressor
VSTVGKALALLDQVSQLEADAGLSEIARLCGFDKATARRLLVEWEKHGFIEQDAATKRYRLGPAPVRLARIREARYPLLRTAVPIIDELAEECGETVHLSSYAGGRLSTIHVAESARANRVNVKIGTILPFHATASGIAFLASSTRERIEAALSQPLEAFTPQTVTDPAALRRQLEATVTRGFSVCRHGLEVGVISCGASIAPPGGEPVGTVAIAAPAARIDEKAVAVLGAKAVAAARRIIAGLYGAPGGNPPQARSKSPAR